MIKLILTGLVLFATLGVFVAEELLTRVGLQPSYLYVALGGVMIALLLVFRSARLIFAAALLALAITLPDATLSGYGLDKDMLLAILLTVLLLPFVQRAGLR